VCVNENAKRGHQYQGRIEAGDSGVEEARAAPEDRQEKSERIDCERKTSGPILRPKDGEARRHAPIHQGSFFEITNAVGVKGNPVMPHNHFPRHFGMHRVGIIQKRRAEKREASVEQQPETCKRENYFPRTAREIGSDGRLQNRQ
jgi:hypothetical protein